MKSVTIQSNFNNKLGSKCWVHVSISPPSPVPEHKLGQAYQVKVQDGSHPGVKAELIFFQRFSLDQVTSIFTMPSHGMKAPDFVNWIRQQQPEVNWDTELAAYFYQTVDNFLSPSL